MMKQWLALVPILLTSIGCFAQATQGYVRPIAFTALAPDGSFKYVSLNNLGAVVDGNSTGNGNINAGPGGFMEPVAPVALDPNGAFQYMKVDLNGALITTDAASTGTGGGSAASTTIEQVATTPGILTFTHGLNSLAYFVHCNTRVGSAYGPATYTDYPSDANTAKLTVPAAGDYICSFMAAAPLPVGFFASIAPSTLTYQPTMKGTQTATGYTVTQSIQSGYSGTATYSLLTPPSGITGTFSPTTVTGAGTTALSLSFPSSQTPGSNTITVKGLDGSLSSTANASLVIGTINQGLVDGWPMNDGSGTTFANADSVSANIATVAASSVTWGTHFTFPGSTPSFSSTAYALSANHANVAFSGTTPFSVSAWFSVPDISNYHAIVSTLDPSNSYIGWDLTTNTSTGTVNLWLSNVLASNAIQISTVAAVTVNTMTYLVMTYDGSRSASGVHIYLNGIDQSLTIAENNLSATIASTRNLAIGARPDGSIPIGSGGVITAVRIYNRVLSATDVTNYFAAGAR